MKHLIVVGGGAAGFFCAVNAARLASGLRVTIIEKSDKLLSKVKVSGGGRCNVTHACFDISEITKKYPRGSNFVKKAFHQFFTTDTIQWFEERGVKVKAEADGRMFPVTNSSQTIIDCLLKEAAKYEVDIILKTEIKSIQKTEEKFILSTANNQKLVADFVCIAAGGYPKTSMFEWLRQTGHTISQPVPSLFTFNLSRHSITGLMGVVAEPVKVKIKGTKLEQEGPVLITHWGLSGPCILKLSAYAARELSNVNWEFEILINWIAGFTEQDMREKMLELRNTSPSQKAISKNSFGLPARLWEHLAETSGVNLQMRWADLPMAIQNKWIKNLCAFECNVSGKTTFKEEFVTAGGISLSEIDANTMMSKKLSGLFFAGEVLDVDGVTGGFNFQHAWTSGWVAATAIAKLSK